MRCTFVIRVLVTVLALASAWFAAAAPAHALVCNIFGCNCSVSATTVNFQTINPLNGAQNAEGEVTVDCSGLAELFPSMPVRIQSGMHGTISARKMRSPAGDLLDYNLYTTSQHTTIWGNGTVGTAASVSGGLLGLGHWTATRTIYGVVTPTIATKPAIYSDTVVIRIDW